MFFLESDGNSGHDPVNLFGEHFTIVKFCIFTLRLDALEGVDICCISMFFIKFDWRLFCIKILPIKKNNWF